MAQYEHTSGKQTSITQPGSSRWAGSVSNRALAGPGAPSALLTVRYADGSEFTHEYDTVNDGMIAYGDVLVSGGEVVSFDTTPRVLREMVEFVCPSCERSAENFVGADGEPLGVCESCAVHVAPDGRIEGGAVEESGPRMLMIEVVDGFEPHWECWRRGPGGPDTDTYAGDVHFGEFDQFVKGFTDAGGVIEFEKA